MRKFLLALPLLVLGGLLTIYITNKEDDSREAYEAYLAEHPFIKEKLDPRAIKEMPKKDRPDLAWRQNYMMTMNPDTKRPAPENLPEVVEFINNKKMLRGPGADVTPWVERGPNNVGGRTRAIAFDPSDATGKKVWAGGVTGGLWYNNDITSSSTEWVNVGDFWDNIAISAIAFDPNDDQTIYVGTGEGYTVSSKGAGIWKSTNGGSSWTQLSSTSAYYYVNDIQVRNESNTSVVYAAVGAQVAGSYFSGNDGDAVWGFQSTGLYRSTDGGDSFTEVLGTTNDGYGYDVSDIEIGADNALWVATKDAVYGNLVSGGYIFKSSNGTSWTEVYSLTDGDRIELACAPTNANYAYAIVEVNDQVHSIIKTTDGGSNFTSLGQPDDADSGIPSDDFSRNQANYDLSIAVDPLDENTLIVGAINLFRSTNGGSSWSQISKWVANSSDFWDKPYSYVHADQHAAVFSPIDANTILFGTDGGVFYTNDIDNASSNDVIEARNNGYNVTQFYTCDISGTSGEDKFIAGTQDNGTQYFTNAGVNSTVEVFGGDGAACFIDEDNSNIQIVSYVYNNYYQTANGWASSASAIIEDQSSGLFINPADYDDRLNILYANSGASELLRVTGIGSNTSSTGIGIDIGSDATHIKVSPYTTSSSTLFLGTAAGRLFKMTGAEGSSPSISEIGGDNFPNGWISCVEVGASENELLVTFSNYGITSVWYTSDGGSNWVSKEGDLPDMPVRSALFNPTNRNEVILATELGVWSTSNISVSSPTWRSSSSGLATVRVDMLKMRSSDLEVIAATYGRGLFSSNAFAADIAPVAEFTVSSNLIEAGSAVTYTDVSVGSPTSWEWTFNGGSPSSSTEQNPVVTYDSVGVYSTTLTVTNANGSDDTMISGVITVVDHLDSCGLSTNVPDTASVFIYGTGSDQGSWGSWSGHNNYEILKYAEHFTGYTGNSVSGVLFTNGQLANANSNSSVTVTVYDGGSSPGSTLFSKEVLISDFKANDTTYVSFGENVMIGDDFYIGWELDYSNTAGSDLFTVYQSRVTSGGTAFAFYNGAFVAFTDLFQTPWHTNFSVSANICTTVEAVSADFTANVTSIGEWDSVNFTNNSTGTDASYAWVFEGANPDASTDENPSVTYASTGTYDVTLIVTNDVGADTMIKQDYITVNEAVEVSDTVIVDNCSELTNVPDGANLYYYSTGSETGSWGTWGGHNNYDIPKYAEHFSNYSGNAVSSVKMTLGPIEYADDESYINIVVYDAGTGAPGTELHTQKVLMKDLVANQINTIDFGKYVSVGSEFYIGWELDYSNGEADKFIIVTSEATEGGTAYAHYNGSFVAFTDLFSTPWHTNFAISPNVCQVTKFLNADFVVPEVCAGETFTVVDQSSEAESYEWSFEGLNNASSTSSGNQTLTAVAGGTKKITLIVTGQGGSKDTLEHSFDVAEPQASFTVLSNDVETNTNVMFTNSSSGSSSYEWSFGDGNSSTSANPVHSYSDASTYTVTLVAKEGRCEDQASSTITVSIPVGIEESVNKLNVYPNPVRELVNVNLDLTQDISLKIVDVQGKTIIQLDDLKNVNQIDMSQYPSGVYFLYLMKGAVMEANYKFNKVD